MSYYSRKLGGIGYAIGYIRQTQEIRNNAANAKQKQEIQKKKDKAAQSATLDKTIGNSAFSLGGVSAMPVINKLISIGKKLKNIKNTQGENENENAEEPQNEEGETYNADEEPQDFEEDFEDFEPDVETDIAPTPMTDAELEQFSDPFTRESENVRGNLRFGDTETSNMPDEADISELPETEPEDLSFLQNTLSNSVFGKQPPKTIFKPSGSEGAGDSNVEVETGGNDVGVELNPDTLEPLGESKIETFENIPEADDDFQNILNMANKTGSFAPEAEIVGGNTQNITGTVSIESVEPAEPAEPDGFETIDEDALDADDYGPSNLTEGGYDIQRFTRSGEDMANQQFGGDSTIARLGGGNEESPADGIEGLDDAESVFSPDRISSQSDIGNMADVGDVGTEVGTEAAEVGTETAEVGAEVAGETALDTAAASADAIAGSTAAVPFVDIATATIGAVLTTAAIGVGIGLGVKNLVDSNAANKQVVSQPDNTQPNNNILSYVGAESENYLNH